MIKRITVRYLKQFAKQIFDLSDHVILAGPNNSGKTTLLQAIVIWNLALKTWNLKRGPESGSKAKERTGIPITRKDFTAIPLREMNMLWTDAATGLKKEELSSGQNLGEKRVLSIRLDGKSGSTEWKSEFELRYENAELIRIKPKDDVPKDALDLNVVHIPPFSGIGSEETRYDMPYQDLLIGQGKGGDILRNLLLEVYQESEASGSSSWNELTGYVEEIFNYRLLPPEYKAQPFILCEYLKGVPSGKGKNGLPKLDLASAGSGFHQVLLILAFFYARSSSIILLDEPDAHLHVILQKQIYDTLRRIASQRKRQLIIATHAEVLIDSTSPDQILSFYGQPHLLVNNAERDQVREAIRRLPATDILLSEESNGILYLEDTPTFDLLKSWAKILGHPASNWFNSKPFWHNNKGRNPKEAKGHFFALRAIRPHINGILLLDGDNRQLEDRELTDRGLIISRWHRYEAESYLVHPDAICRFVEKKSDPLTAHIAREYLADQLPPAIVRNPLGEHDYYVSAPVSKTLLPELFQRTGLPVKKEEYYLIAEQMKKSEIPNEIGEKLDIIWRAFGR